MHVLDPWIPHVAAVFHGFTALVWGILASSYCRCHGRARPEGQLLRLFRLLGWLFAAHYGSKAILDYAPREGSPIYLLACAVGEATICGVLMVFRHLLPLGILGEPKPSRRWLAMNYGLGAVGLLSLGADRPGPVDPFDIFITGLTSLILWDLLRYVRGGRRPILMADLRLGGFLMLAVALFGGVVVLGFTEQIDSGAHSGVWITAHIFVGLAAALPFVLRILGEVLRSLATLLLRMSLGFLLFFGLQPFLSPRPAPSGGPWNGGLRAWDFWGGARPAAELAAVVVLVAILGPGAAWLSRRVDRLMLHHDHHGRRLLQSSVRQLPPEVGIEELCRRATLEVTRVLRVAGAGILVEKDGGAQWVGDLDLEPVARIWPGADDEGALPESAVDLLWVDEERLQEALYDARITWLAPITSPRHRWGYLFVSAGLLGNAASHARLETLEDFGRELGLLLDAADLLVRVRAAERELARSEKLAALGEAAARLAHEIRNPVTAARSLAQLLAREPTSPLNAEHAELVVRELDRVEGRIRSLLDFAGRDCGPIGPVDLSRLVASTLRDLQACRPSAGVETHLALEKSVHVTGDPERLRQVLVNLFLNAYEAFEGAAAAEPAELWVSVVENRSEVELRVADSGPGVPPRMLPRLFEPFATSKIRGTGLGLAIARKIVESHGGRLEATEREGGGTEFRARLPRCSHPVSDPVAVPVPEPAPAGRPESVAPGSISSSAVAPAPVAVPPEASGSTA